MNKLTVGLLRVSTDMQDLESQRTAILECCKSKNIIIDKWVEEYDVSGYTTPLDERKGLMEIKELAINNELERIVIFNLDRIGRDSEFNSYVTLLDNLNVEILSATEGIITNENINDKLINNIKFWMAESESVKIGLRSKAGLLNINKQNKFSGGVVNFGYRKNKTTGQLEINSDEAIIVKRIFREYLTKGAINIARDLTLDGIKKRGTKGKEVDFSASSINKMLENKIYIGYKRYGCNIKTSKDKTNTNRKYDRNKIQYQDYNSDLQIIDNETFEKVQELRKDRYNRKGENNRNTTRSKELLEGLVYHVCGDDKIRKMYVNYTYSNGKVATYKCKHCSNYAYKGVKKNYKAEGINEFVEEYVKRAMNRLDEDKLRENLLKLKDSSIVDIEVNISTLTKELENQEKIYNNANKELEKYFLGESQLTGDIISSIIKKSDIKIKELNSHIKDSRIKLKANEDNNLNISNIINKYKDFNSLYQIANISKRKAMLSEIIDKVIVQNDEIEIVLKLGIFFKDISYS